MHKMYMFSHPDDIIHVAIGWLATVGIIVALFMKERLAWFQISASRSPQYMTL